MHIAMINKRGAWKLKERAAGLERRNGKENYIIYIILYYIIILKINENMDQRVRCYKV